MLNNNQMEAHLRMTNYLLGLSVCPEQCQADPLNLASGDKDPTAELTSSS
jgi:hypothetical protein